MYTYFKSLKWCLFFFVCHRFLGNSSMLPSNFNNGPGRIKIPQVSGGSILHVLFLSSEPCSGGQFIKRRFQLTEIDSKTEAILDDRIITQLHHVKW